MTDLDDLLRRGLRAEAERRVPAAEIGTAWRRLTVSRERVARHRRWRYSAAGVGLAGGLAAALLLAVWPSATVRPPAVRPQPDRVLLGPPVSSLSSVSGTAAARGRWGEAVFSDSRIGWAAGSVCDPKATHTTCRTWVSRTTDAGRNWSRPEQVPSELTTPIENTQLVAVRGGVYLASWSPDVLLYRDDTTASWTRILLRGKLGPYGTIGLGLAFIAVRTAQDKVTMVVVTPPDSHTLSLCATSATRQDYRRAVAVASVPLPASDVDSVYSPAADGSVWRTILAQSCRNVSPSDGSQVQVSSDGHPLGTFTLPSATEQVIPVDRNSAWATTLHHGLYLTHDSGRTWQRVDTSADTDPVVPTSPGRALRKVFDHGADAIVSCTDQGCAAVPALVSSGWHDQPGLFSIETGGGFASVIAQGGRVLVSDDEGRTWHLQGLLPSIPGA
jgi:hypothetical protein